jgi:hypothetical protein
MRAFTFTSFCFFLLMGITFQAQAQRNCGAMDHLEHQIQMDPQRALDLDAIERHTREVLNNPSPEVTGVITIPVVVHVVYNNSTENISTAQIQSQIDVLNEDFRRLNSDADGTWSQAADSEIEFCLATTDPNGNATDGITRTSTSVTSFSTNDNVKFNSSGGKDAWPASDYLNMWVCDLGGGLLGYAQFPGGPASTDGVVCDYAYFGTIGTATAPFDLGRTTTHEVGHWLNLRHIWGDGNCNVDDFVNDTPTSDAPNYGCALGHVSCNSTDMVQNYMDYSDDACMNLYTLGQKNRMRALFSPGGARESLLASAGCGGTPPPPPPACTDNIVNITLVTDNYPGETTWSLTDGGGNTIASGGPYSTAGQTITQEFCLPDGCYDFTINDSYGDGICCAYGNGSYSLTDDQGNPLASGGAFASTETTNFCLGGGGGVPGCTDPSAHNYDPAATVDDGSCETCTDGVQNGDETGVDCGGVLCDPCSGGGGCTYSVINNATFESGWGIWNDAGSDCRRSANDAAYANNGTYCVRIRDNSGSSNTFTDNLNLTAYDELTVDVSWIFVGMDNGEGFVVEYSTNGGSSYTTVASAEVGSAGNGLSNNVRYNGSVVIPGPFSSNTRLRFRSTGTVNADRAYLDDIVISGCSGGARVDDEPVFEVVQEVEVAANKQEGDAGIHQVSLFPNPTSSLLNIQFSLAKEQDVQLLVTDLTGKTLSTESMKLNAGQQETEIDASAYPAGVYFAHLITDTGRISKKFVVTR